ncbi:enoyl-CoA hydratase/isomerase family protein [Myxococcota bacterium]|nr:enoyl-CoA hydratase/isomerase family protein [Myxococcota bacterium]
MSAWSPESLPRGEGALRSEPQPGWTELVLDNPSARNALSPGMMVDLGAAVARLEAEPPAAVVLRGQGEAAFCAGGDLRAVRSHLLAPGSAGGMLDHMADLLDRLQRLPTLVIAAVEGAALGGGAELLTACDLVIAARDAQVGFVHARLGVSPGWGGGARLVRRVGSRRAALVLLPVDGPTAERAAALGLVDELVPPGQALARAREVATRVAAWDRQAVAAALRIARSGEREVEREAFCALWGGPAHREALRVLDKGRA